MTSPLRSGADADAWRPSVLPAAGDGAPIRTVTRFPMYGTVMLVLPMRYFDKPLPDWGLKWVMEEFRSAAKTLLATMLDAPAEVWRQACLNGDVEVMMVATFGPSGKSFRKVGTATSQRLFGSGSTG